MYLYVKQNDGIFFVPFPCKPYFLNEIRQSKPGLGEQMSKAQLSESNCPTAQLSILPKVLAPAQIENPFWHWISVVRLPLGTKGLVPSMVGEVTI